MGKVNKIKDRIACLEEKHADQSTVVDYLSIAKVEPLNLREEKKKKLAFKDEIERLKKQL